MRKILPSVILFLASLTALSADPTPFIVRRFPRKVHVTYTLRPVLADRGDFKQLLVLPVPASDEKREIENLHIQLPEGIQAQQRSFPETGDPYLAVITRGSLKANVVIEYDATLYDIHYNLPPAGALRPYDRSSNLFRMYTGKDSRFEPDHPEIRKIADRYRQDAGDVITFARKVYAHEQSTLKWKNTGRYGTISEIFANGGGDCGALTAVLVSVLRNRGIPARAHIGGVIQGNDRWEWHVWPEFYLEGYGWVELDPAYFTSPPGFFAYDDGLRIHFQRASTVTVDVDDFHFATGGVQTYALYRMGVVSAPGTDTAVTTHDPLNYAVDVTVRTLSLSNVADDLVSEERLQRIREDILTRIVEKRKEKGLSIRVDPALNIALTRTLADEIVPQIRERSDPATVDCRRGCPDPTPTRERGGSSLPEHLAEQNIRFSGYSWQIRVIGFQTDEPAPYIIPLLDDRFLLDSSWATVGVGYVFDTEKRQHRVAVLFGNYR